MSKQANPDHPIMDVIAKRWSPYGFSSKPVSLEDLRSIFEAARWSASSFNEQPWRYILATDRESAIYRQVLSCLAEPNQNWAKQAPVLALGVMKTAFTRNDKPNRVALHDLGQASATLTLEALARGIYVHQMAGILPEKAQDTFGVPDGYEVATALALGYPAQPNEMEEELRARDEAPRSRHPLREFVFGMEWEAPAFKNETA